jgi:hypothetical protein
MLQVTARDEIGMNTSVGSALTVFTVANIRYEPFVLPFSASVLYHNPDAVVEIQMERPDEYRAQNHIALDILANTFSGRLRLSRGDFAAAPNPQVMRFLATPAEPTEFVYIGDIDILVLESIAPGHLAHMERTGLSYSNIVRSTPQRADRAHLPRMSGLHFTRWSAFYPQVQLDDPKLVALAEFCLYALVTARNPAPDKQDTYRPLHGYHLTLSRPPYVLNNGWGGTYEPQLLDAYLALRETPFWRAVVPLFDKRYRQLLGLLDAGLSATFQNYLPPLPGTLPREWW